MVQNNSSNLSLLVCLVALCALPKLLALPITSKPYARSPDHLAWDILNGPAYDPLDPTADGYEKPKKILPKSIFIAPTLQNSVTTCGPGYTRDHLGNCIQTFQINHNQLLLNQLEYLLQNHHHQQQEQQQQQTEDSYDYDYETDPTTSSPTSKDFQKGPFQLTLPVQLESRPQAWQSPEPFRGSSFITTTSTSTIEPRSTTPVTTRKPLATLTSLLEGIFPINKDPFGLMPRTTTPRSVPTTTEQFVETTTNLPTTLNGDDDAEETTSNPDSGVTMPYEQQDVWRAGSSSSKDGAWSTSEFATELANEQLVPVTSTTQWEEATTSDAELLLSNAEGTTTYEVATETRDDMASNGAIGTSAAATTTTPFSSPPKSSSSYVAPTTPSRPEATETVLPVQVTEKSVFPTIPSLFSSGSSSSGHRQGLFDWRSRHPISIVTPVPNPFPFQRTSSSLGGSLFKFTVPVTTTTTPRTTTTETAAAAPQTPQVPELLLAVENESENSQKLRESLMESEQKEMNYENIDVNNRFIYHHLNGLPAAATTTHADQPQQGSTSSLSASQPIVVDDDEEYRILTQVDSTTEKSLTAATEASTTPSFAQKLAEILRPKESERHRVSSASLWSPYSPSFSTVTTTPATTTTRQTTTEQTTTPFALPSYSQATTSKFEEFLRASSNRIRFPGPSVNRQPAPNKLIPNAQQLASRSQSTGSEKDKEKKKFWWFPAGFEVDTNQKEKPVLLRFWTKMPLIPDTVASQRRSSGQAQQQQSTNSRSNRENSKSPSDNLYREVAFQDISRAFQDRRLKGAVAS